LLRLPRLEYFDRFAELHAHQAAARHHGGHGPHAAASRRFLGQPDPSADQGLRMFPEAYPDSDPGLGQLGPTKPQEGRGNVSGGSFDPDAWGRGYALEAGVAAIDWALEHLGWDDIIHCIAPANQASQKVAARLGSTLRGTGRMPPPHEEFAVEIWGQTRAQWQDNRRRFG